MVTDHLGVVHTVDGLRLEAMLSDCQVVLIAEPCTTLGPALVFAPDQAEKLGRALWDLGRED